MQTDTILGILQNYAGNSGHVFQLCFEGYAEPGYDDPESEIIALGDWNSQTVKRRRYMKNSYEVYNHEDNTMPRIAAILERMGAKVEWGDEWYFCENCCKLIRNQPNSYSWTPSFWQEECMILCHECVLDDPEGYLESLEGNHRNANTLGLDLGAQRYVKTDGEYENGFHPGQNDDPEVIAESLRKLGIKRFIFEIDSTGQFDMNFSVWVHKTEYNKLSGELNSEGINIAGAMQSALKDASAKIGELQGEGVKVAKCYLKGTATARPVSQEDFIAGKAFD